MLYPDTKDGAVVFIAGTTPDTPSFINSCVGPLLFLFGALARCNFQRRRHHHLGPTLKKSSRNLNLEGTATKFQATDSSGCKLGAPEEFASPMDQGECRMLGRYQICFLCCGTLWLLTAVLGTTVVFIVQFIIGRARSVPTTPVTPKPLRRFQILKKVI